MYVFYIMHDISIYFSRMLDEIEEDGTENAFPCIYIPDTGLS